MFRESAALINKYHTRINGHLRALIFFRINKRPSSFKVRLEIVTKV